MDDDQRRRRTVPSLLRYTEQYATSSTRQQRTKAKVTTNEIRENVRKRVDAGAEIMCLRIMATQLTRNEWRCFIALKEGVLFRPDRTWFVVPPPAKTASPEVCGRHYGLSEATVERYERAARKVLHRIREAAGLTGDVPRVPVWPAINSDENLVRYLFGKG